MTKSKSSLRPILSKRHHQLILLTIAVVAGVLFRFAYLASDPPWDFTWSQALFTDGARAIDGARSKIIFDQWIVDERSPVVLFYPLINFIAFIVFKIMGVGLLQANLCGVIPSLATLVILYLGLRGLAGEPGGILAVFLLSFSYLHVVYSRVPMVESLEIFLLVACFFLLLKGLRGSFFCGLLIGLAAMMVKMHTLHILPVAIAFKLFEERATKDRSKVRSIVALAIGFGASLVLWYVTVYRINPPILTKYFKSNIFVAQRGEYANASFSELLTRRLGALIHIGSGKDGFFAKVPILYLLGAAGSISILSGFGTSRQQAKPWERLALIWLVGTMLALSLLSYRPLRYLTLILPSLVLVATSFMVRLAEGKPIFSASKPRWFGLGFCIWLTAVLIHFYQDLAFAFLTRAGSRNPMWLVRTYQSIWLKILLFGFASIAIWLTSGSRLKNSKGILGIRARSIIFFGVIVGTAILGSMKFADFASTRKYSIMDGAQSLKRILGENVFLVGDCSTSLSLETNFRTLPAYGDLIRYNERNLFERYPITHFLLRFPTLYEYLSKTYSDFKDQAIPIRTFVLCGREATVVRYKEWPGTKNSDYDPTQYEIGMEKLARSDFNGALADFEEFLASHKDSYECLAAMAICYMQLGKPREALSSIEQAVEISKRDAVVYEIYGDILSSLGRNAQAQQAWLRALKLNPNSRKLRTKISRGRF